MSEISNQDFKKDVKKILLHYLSYYRMFLGAILLFLMAVFFYNKTLIPNYSNQTRIHLVKDLSGFFSTDFSFETSVASPQMYMRYGLGMEDELILINSYSIIQKTIKQLKFEVTYFKKDTIFPRIPFLNNKTKNIELYSELPIQVLYDASHPQAVYKEFMVEIVSDSTYKLSCEKEDGYSYNYIDYSYLEDLNGKGINTIVPFNTIIENEFLKFQIVKNENIKNYKKGDKLYFYFNDMDNLTLNYQENIKVSQESPTSFIINIGLAGTNFNKVSDFLNLFTENVLSNDLDQKTELAGNTIKFIDKHLGSISDSLNTAKENLQEFRSYNQVTDLSFQGQQLLDKASTLETEKASLVMQEKYYKYLIKYITTESKGDKLVSPSSMNVLDPVLTNMITQLNTFYGQYNNYNQSSTNSIYIKDLRIKIDNQEKAIVENAKNNLNTIQISINELNYRLDKLNRKISELPKTELKLIDIERKFKLNDEVLTFLMQKRSEAQIAMASTRPSYEVIEPARYILRSNDNFRKKINYIVAFLLGCFLPFMYILIRDFFDNKVHTKYDINKIKDLVFMGNVLKNRAKKPLCAVNQPDSVVAESFRAIKTNLEFISDSVSESIVIAATSSSSGEGKTFFASNLAATYASSGLKTVILEFDLRRPQVGSTFNVQSDIGLTSYLSNNALTYDIVIAHETLENLSIILAGKKAPNPADLISSKKAKELIEDLRASYDVIILDTPPIGLVSETFYLLNLCDIRLFVVRSGYSNKELVSQTIEMMEDRIINKKFGIVLNDVDEKTLSNYHKAGYDNYYRGDRKKRFSLLRK